MSNKDKGVLSSNYMISCSKIIQDDEISHLHQVHEDFQLILT